MRGTVLDARTAVAGFIKKLKLWSRRVEKNVVAQFPTLDAFLEECEEVDLDVAKEEIVAHLSGLSTNLEGYFPDLDTSSMQWCQDPFNCDEDLISDDDFPAKEEFLKTNTLLGHLMSIERRDPSVTRRYYYSIKDISIGGRCVCNGHAGRCEKWDPNDKFKRLCNCEHNTCGASCERCCPFFVQKKWRQPTATDAFECEPCNCFGHSNQCEYDEEVDQQGLSLDIQGRYEGGGVCQNCQHNTDGINCNKCKPGFYRPWGKQLNDTDVCQPCQCNNFYSTGSCADGDGKCECRAEFQPPNCDACSPGYYDYPRCKPCDCFQNGTVGQLCETGGGQCPCQPNYTGKNCRECAPGYYSFPDCLQCQCNPTGASDYNCDIRTGQCNCRGNFGGLDCGECADGYFAYPVCQYCDCDPQGTLEEICDKSNGQCLCKEGYAGARCDQCAPGFYNYPTCIECQCSENGSSSNICDTDGKCSCLSSYSGRTCDRCSPGHYKYPECIPCDCAQPGSIGVSCDDEGRCQCRMEFTGIQCERCQEGFYNYPLCEGCNCDPAGVKETFGGCGTLPVGELCECKERVTGRICDTCKPLYWNLQVNNPYACEDCNCFQPGVLANLMECDSRYGQCTCKLFVTGRQCQSCIDGFYNMTDNNALGCQDCQCNIGGSVSRYACDKQSGQCSCRPKVHGKRCDEPIDTYYFPTLHQYKYEIEDGITPAGGPARFGYDEAQFPGFSWRGYAAFNQLQEEVLQDVTIPKSKSSLYRFILRFILRYVNPGPDMVLARIKMDPANDRNSPQDAIVRLEPSPNPTLVTVSGEVGGLPSPFVLNPDNWKVSIKSPGPVFIDYFVLLPSEYFEGTALEDVIRTPCTVDGNPQDTCTRYTYPVLNSLPMTESNDAYVVDDDGSNRIDLSLLHLGHSLPGSDRKLHFDGLGPVMQNYQRMLSSRHLLFIGCQLDVSALTPSRNYRGNVLLTSCSFTDECRSIVTSEQALTVLDIPETEVRVSLGAIRRGNGNGGSYPLGPQEFGVEKIIAVPLREWKKDMITPKEVCTEKDGKCLERRFPNPPDSTKVEAESPPNTNRVASNLPPNAPENAELVYLDSEQPTLDMGGTLPFLRNEYLFVIHYHQPEHPQFPLKVFLENGKSYEGQVVLEHCPAANGCRAIIRSLNGERTFEMDNNFRLRLHEDQQKSAWIDYVLAIPRQFFDDAFLEELPLDKTDEFISKCSKNQYSVVESPPEDAEFCRNATFALTVDHNSGALFCDCNYLGSTEYICEKYGGQCACKPNVIGRTCERCRTGFYGFPDCRPCDCPSTALCDEFTGSCICPPRVTGNRCEMCEEMTYGYDPIIGCEECRCNPMGVLENDLQCNLDNGQCRCKENVVGRQCDKLYRTNITYMDRWEGVYASIEGTDLQTSPIPIVTALDMLRVENVQNTPEKGVAYFKAPRVYLGNHMNSYGANLVYKIMSSRTSGVPVNQEPDIMLVGGPQKTILLHSAVFITEDSFDLTIRVPLTESSFRKVDGTYAKRQDLMTVLESLQGLFIRASFWSETRETRLENIAMGSASEQGDSLSAPLAVEIEECQCPAGYTGNSCEECADGYYHISQGSYGGSCIPCECHGHSYECDKVTGVCFNCTDNTMGDHCETCIGGYFGDASPPSGLLTRCECSGNIDASDPFACDPISGQCLKCLNNTFGEGCKVCAPGYYGDAISLKNCQSCACDTCGTSSCDSFTGRCTCKPNVECTSCHHDLLDVTDELKGQTAPVLAEISSKSSTFYATRRLNYFNETADKHFKDIETLVSVDLKPLTENVNALEETTRMTEGRSNSTLAIADSNMNNIGTYLQDSYKVAQEIQSEARPKVDQAINSLRALASNPHMNSVINSQERLIEEANMYLDDLKQLNFTDEMNNAMVDLEKAENYLLNISERLKPVVESLEKRMESEARYKDIVDRMDSFKNYTDAVKIRVAETMNILRNVNRQGGQWMSEEIARMGEEAQNFSISAQNITAEANKILAEADSQYNDLEIRETQLDATKEYVAIRVNSLSSNELPDRGEVYHHVAKLERNASMTENLFKGTKEFSVQGIEAANSYGNILSALDRSHSEEALELAKEADEIKQQIQAQVQESNKDARDYYSQAIFNKETLQSGDATLIQTENDLETLRVQNDKNEEELKQLRELEEGFDARFGDLSAEAIQTANQSLFTRMVAESAENTVANVLDSMPLVQRNVSAGQTVKDVSSITKFAETQLDNVENILPGILEDIERIKRIQAGLKLMGKGISTQMESLKKKIDIARSQTNRIKVGVEFAPNTTLELIPPENLEDATLYTKASMYFRTPKENGFLLFLGNQKNTEGPQSNDFLALEIESGFPVLTANLGDGLLRTAGEKFVANDQWYKIIAERNGRLLSLAVLEELPNKSRKTYYAGDPYPGQNIGLDLDKKTTTLHVGGFPPEAAVPKVVKFANFEGAIEELTINDSPVGLWNFKKAQNQRGALERNKLDDLVQPTGMRFNGKGYVMMPRKPHRFRNRFNIRLKFKTLVGNGLLFVAGKHSRYLSIELRDGRIMYKYDLGDGPSRIISQDTFADGNWHVLQAVRQGRDGRLLVDAEEIGRGESPGTRGELPVSDYIFFGGYPKTEKYNSEVTRMGFDGCLDDIEIGSLAVDLSQHREAIGVVSGCPPTQSRAITLSGDERDNFLEATVPETQYPGVFQAKFRFRTNEPDGTLMYAPSINDRSYIAVLLRNGVLSLESEYQTLTSGRNQYADGKWHHVLIKVSNDLMEMNVDDLDTSNTSYSGTLLAESSNGVKLSDFIEGIYFGGLPGRYYARNTVSEAGMPFKGCIADVTIQEDLLNFAEASESGQSVKLDRCDIYPEGSPKTEETFAPEEPTFPEIFDSVEPLRPPPQKTTATPLEPEPLPDVEYPEYGVDEDEYQMPTDKPATTKRPAPTPEPDGCALPLVPREDFSRNPANVGYHFSISSDSRLEYDTRESPIPKTDSSSAFSLSFKTTSGNGVMFYVSDQNHIDFIAVYMQNGRVFYAFNSGSGAAVIESQPEFQYNDGNWHTLDFKRNQKRGELFIDGVLVSEGNSQGNTASVNVDPIIYIGGLPIDMKEGAKQNLDGSTGSFQGCLKDFRISTIPITPQFLVPFDVIPCYPEAETGIFVFPEGGYVVPFEKFRVGKMIEVKMEVKPRTQNGILFAVHGKNDFFLLQMIDGAVRVSVDNGGGPFSSTYNPPKKNFLCDGKWHTIQVVKTQNLVTISIDDVFTNPGIGTPGITNTDTSNPLYIGGHPDPEGKRGVETTEQFVGCIRNLKIVQNSRDIKTDLANSRKGGRGKVYLSVCPTN
ncbi:unnamed protein product [Cyprideis torosa]|uniref:Laminin subunit alpha-1 n=1 Tax=Cyprideis torosa TaxID=163714 RepID=A0A7R8ZTV0_9CRUS|nr:unnamed protein product [Cyprideis torosa]CAG0898967.1 unnamed protein product [Cyprideis torosa]